MREIEFRGYSKRFERWLYGFLIADNTIREFGIKDKGHEVLHIGQYTGIKDKKGTKIFEGDIIKTYHGNARVVFSAKYALFGYIMIEKDNHEKEYDYRFTDIAIEDGIEVIGNIYDHNMES